MIVVNLPECSKANSDQENDDIQQIVRKSKKPYHKFPEDAVSDPIRIGKKVAIKIDCLKSGFSIVKKITY